MSQYLFNLVSHLLYIKEHLNSFEMKVQKVLFQVMFLSEHFKILLRIFSFAGLAPIFVTAAETNYTYLIPAILTSLTSIVIVTFLLFFPHFESYGPINTIINFASLTSSLLMILSANWQCYYYKSVYLRIVRRIQQMENRFTQTFSKKSSLKIIAFRYRLKVLLIFFLFFLSQGLVFTEAWLVGEAHGLVSSFFTSLSRFMYPIIILHIVLYSDTVTIFIQELNEDIRNSPICFHSSAKMELLKKIKLMHMDVWKLVMQLNRYFGWNLLFLVLSAFVYITYQLYWIFLTLQVKWNPIGLIGRLICG